MRISHKTAIEQMDSARKLEATDQALVLCEKHQQRIAGLEALLKECVELFWESRCPKHMESATKLCEWYTQRNILLAKIKELP